MISPLLLGKSHSFLYSEFVEYLLGQECPDDGDGFLPPMNELSKELGISQNKLREQIEVAKALGIVEVNPRRGIQRLPYTFFPAVSQSLLYSLSLDCWKYFEAFSELRNHIEASFWHQAAPLLTPEDILELKSLVDNAWNKLRSTPIQIPHQEHKELHLKIYARVDNPFALGILEAYWQAYETVRLNLYTDYNYLEKVWRYHSKIVNSICAGDFDTGYQALIEHKELIYHQLKLKK